MPNCPYYGRCNILVEMWGVSKHVMGCAHYEDRSECYYQSILNRIDDLHKLIRGGEKYEDE